jgi:hypothetical protein
MQRPLGVLAVAALLAMSAFIIWGDPGVYREEEGDAPAPVGEAKRLVYYKNAQFGFSFGYPEEYVLEEKGNVGDARRARYAFVLTEKSATVPENGDGPTAITLDVFQNLEGYAPLEWVKGMSYSNWKLGDGKYITTTVGGRDAVEYRTTGIYEAMNYVFTDGDAMYMFSVTWLTPEDDITRDFTRVKASFAFGE